MRELNESTDPILLAVVLIFLSIFFFFFLVLLNMRLNHCDAIYNEPLKWFITINVLYCQISVLSFLFGTSQVA